ncbi:MAG: cytochrome-c peroxidase [Verrucomicrobiae bacterium]|nr:cytochrome-c peroxidase [Verrucomicrobiae bacterium]
MKSKLVIVLIVLVLVALALPVSNLVVGLPSNSLTKAKVDDATTAKALMIIGQKCANCHSTEVVRPFYASLPPAKGIVERDIRVGTRELNYLEALLPSDNQPVSEVVLAKTEHAIQVGSMPPTPYLMLHWNGALSGAEKQALLDWVRAVRAKHYVVAGVAPQFQNDPVQPLPEKVDLDARKVALGDKLYHDKRLSKDNSLACAGCHDLAKGGTDQQQYSKGVGGQLGGINAPTTFNAGFQFKQFWDGRAATLEEQADGPPNNPIEMASNWPEIIGKLKQDAEFTKEFTAVYPEGFSKETITSAIATFERTLLTPSRFDKFLRGQADALTADEKRGYELFKSHGCATCHAGKILGGQSFELMSRHGDYIADRGNRTDADLGRYSVTKREDDRGKFKVPTLRNIAITFPYFHDGTVKELKQAVEYMAKYQLGKTLAAADTDAMLKFLHALTGEYNGKPLGK